jgi:hypothetical protein
MEETGNAHKILVGKPEGKRPIRRHRHRQRTISERSFGK